MEPNEILKKMEEIAQTVDALRAVIKEEGDSGCCKAGEVLAIKDVLNTQGETVPPGGTAPGAAIATIDDHLSGDATLGCIDKKYRATSNAGVSSHPDTKTAFSNLRGTSAKFSVIVGHGTSGIIATGNGSVVTDPKKYMAVGNEDAWREYASQGISGSRLVLLGCSVANGTAGMDFLKCVANAVRKEVGAWTGPVWCGSTSVYGTGMFKVVAPGSRLEAVDAPVMYEVNSGMNRMKLQTGMGFQNIDFDQVTSIHFTPVGIFADKSPTVEATGNDRQDLLNTIDFDKPFTTTDRLLGITMGQLVVNFETDGRPGSRSFLVIGDGILQDTVFTDTYYYVNPDFIGSLQLNI